MQENAFSLCISDKLAPPPKWPILCLVGR